MTSVRGRAWRDGVRVADDFPLDDLDAWLADPQALVWLDLCQPEPDVLAHLAAELCLDPRAVEDAVAPGERPKATRHPTHTFVIAYSAELIPEPGQDVPSLMTSRVAAFVMRNGLITVRRGDHMDMDAVVRRWESDPDLLRLGVGALLHGLLDTIVDQHFETIQTIDDALEDMEDLLFDDKVPTGSIQRKVYSLRKDLVQLRRIVLPMREVVASVMRHRTEVVHPTSRELDGWFDDLYDHVLRASEWTESLRDMVTSLFETNLSLQDARLNEVMKKLAAWAAIIAVPTAVTGWFGQNIPYPGFSEVSGLWQSATLILVGSLGLYLLFRRVDWI